MLLFFIFAALGVELFGDLSKDICTMHTGSQARRSAHKHSHTYIPPCLCTGMHWVFNFPLYRFNLFDVNCFIKLFVWIPYWFPNRCLIEACSKDLCCDKWKSHEILISHYFMSLFCSLALHSLPAVPCLLSLWWPPPMWRSRALCHFQKLWDGFPAALQSFHRRQLEWHNEGKCNSAGWDPEGEHTHIAHLFLHLSTYTQLTHMREIYW